MLWLFDRDFYNVALQDQAVEVFTVHADDDAVTLGDPESPTRLCRFRCHCDLLNRW
jgi:hypothetical protein